MPAPLGRVPVRVEGQTDMPINRPHLGEVHPTRDRFSFDLTPSLPYSAQESMRSIPFIIELII